MSTLLVTDAQAHPPTAGLGHWIATGTALAELYPCACDEFDPDPPAWLIEAVRREGGDPKRILRCRPYLAQKGRRAGRWWSYCDCWGRRRDNGLPDHCCAWHEHNPAYAVGSTLSIGPATPTRPATGRRSPFEVSNLPEPDDGLDVEARILLDMDTYREPWVRRWKPEEITCTCPTPWDGISDARKVGFHCCADGCHQNFRNWSASVAHHRELTAPCKDPRTQVNIDGDRVYRGQVIGTFTVWG